MKSLLNKILSTFLCTCLISLLITSAVFAATLATVDSTGVVGQYTSLRLNSSGFPVISYYDSDNSNLKVAVCSDSECVAKTITTVDNSAGDVGQHTSLRLNSSGFPVISYYDATNSDLKVAVCTNATCTANTLTTVDSAGQIGQYTSLALNSSTGFPVISYYDQTNGDLKVAICSNTTCTSKTISTVDNSAGLAGQYTSIALNSSGFPVISYYDYTAGDLKLAVCSNATCTSSTLTTVDSTGIVGQYTSLILNSSGFPVISYYDQTNGDLKVAVCSIATCASKTLATLDGIGDVGQSTSLGLDINNIPSISYYGVTTGDLKLAVCSDTLCASKTITTIDSSGDVGYDTSLVLKNGGLPVISYYLLTTGDLKVAVTPPQTTLVNSILPTSRAIQVGTTATVFHTVINSGSVTATSTSISMVNPPAGTFSYQETNCATNAVIGVVNPLIDIAPGGVACFVLSFTPSAAFSATNVQIIAQASNSIATTLITGVNTWLLRATAVNGPDVIALTTTTDLHQIACSGNIAFAVALSNIGAAATGDITVTANTGGVSLPVSLSIMETNPATSAIIGDNILQGLTAGNNRTVGVFVTYSGCIPFNPAVNRIFVQFRDASNNIVGSTSTAISTNR